MSRLLACLTLTVAALLVAASQAAAGPLYDVKATWGNTNLPPGGTGQFTVQARNIGDATGKEDLILVEQLPAGVTATEVHWLGEKNDFAKFCSGVGTSEVTCKAPAAELFEIAGPAGPGADSAGLGLSPQPSGYLPRLLIEVGIDPGATGEGVNTASLYGGGATLPDGDPCAKEPSESPSLPACASDTDTVPFSAVPSTFGIVAGSFLDDLFDAAYPLGEPVRQAGDRPFELRVRFDLTARTGEAAGDGTTFTVSNGRLRTVEVTMPRGFIGNPEATPKCDPVLFAEGGATASSTACPPSTQVGYLNAPITFADRFHGGGIFLNPNVAGQRAAIYNLEPPKGAAADFGVTVAGFAQGHIYGVPDPAQDYAIKTVTPNIAATFGASVRAVDATLWGVPADPAHDRFRAFSEHVEGKALGAPWGSAPIRPFLTAPTNCGVDNGGARIRVDSYTDPGNFTQTEEYPEPMNVEGCEDPRFRFEPEISLQPTDRDAGAPTGLDVNLEVPQRDDAAKEAKELYAKNGFVKAIPTPPLKKAVVTLPEGMTLSPSAAQGLEACSATQIGLGTDLPVKCPDASQYGTLTLRTPLFPIDAPLKGFLYIAKQGDHPFHDTPFALYLVVEEPDRGILVKQAGRLDLDPQTGQISSTFDDIPQFPISDMQMSIKGGVRAGLVNPSTCGTKTIRAEFFSWHDPNTPHVVDSSYDVTEKPDGSPCVESLGQRPFVPALEAGTLNNAAGRYSPFSLRLTRTDDDQEFSQLDISMPRGLTGKLAGIAECPEAGIAQAIARTGAGEGALEQASPSCPASSYIGSTEVGAGVGVPLTYVPGKVYLAGPYLGAPFSALVITPAVVGPFDLGVVTVRSALRIDPQTADVSIQSDPFPLIYQGIPVRVRDVRVRADRPEFTLNPTSCEVKQVLARVTGTGGDLDSTADDSAADLKERFQAADCASLPFKPSLALRLVGGTRRGAHPKLRATYRARPGDANLAATSAALPRSAFLDQSHIRTVCTRVQFAAEACPAGSIYGHAVARTPLLDEPLTGPIYLRSSDNPLPDLVLAVRGRIDFNAIGRIDSANGGIRTTFDFVPDAPLSSVVLTFQGGRKGLLINSRDLCKGKAPRATVKFSAHNGRRLTLRPPMRSSCAKRGAG